ncbi:hypothetical protein KC360_g1778 [Hortaea werneckii]|nr:hypothetical protein KC325_g2451 [Hortaea werneckii]KAI6997529.1 hypothetical protein KC359_g2927 [Hortaea werneckii]KAI7148332.1 hypothetical protein KC344_g2078 [Hortaea werneckii]KAI7178205.1 hypothetical protein KC360_g1778 [Hortaea werneckii]
MTTETPRLDTIAPELLKTIFDFVSGPDTLDGGTVDTRIWRVRTLRALTMTSRQLRYESLPYLYRRFEPSGIDISLPLFARSLCENPELAKCVQLVDAGILCTTRARLPNQQDVETVKAALLSLKLPKRSFGIEAALDENYACAFSFMLISLTTRLKFLKLSFADSGNLSDSSQSQLNDAVRCPYCHCFNESLQALLVSHSHRHQYAQLESFQFGPPCDDGLGLFATMLQLPGMRDITLISFGDVSSSYDWTDCTSLSTVEDIHIEDSFLLDKDIAGLITCCKKLRSLSIWWNCDAIDMYRISSPAVDTSTVLAALKSHRECLETLSLTNSYGPSFVSSYPTKELSYFTALSDLDVDDNFLLEGGTWHSFELPPNLKVLTIYMETPFIGFTEVFRAIGQTAQSALVDLTITIPFVGNESLTAPFVGVCELVDAVEIEKDFKAIHIDNNKEGLPWIYRLWTEKLSKCIKMRFLGGNMAQFMDFCAEKVVMHGVDFLINTEDYLTDPQSPYMAE